MGLMQKSEKLRTILCCFTSCVILKNIIVSSTVVIITFLLFYSNHVSSLYRLSTYKDIDISSGELHNLAIEGVNYRAIGEDPQIIFYNTDVHLENIDIYISDVNYRIMNWQIYYDCGKGFSEDDSIKVRLRKGHNLIKIPKNNKISNLRLDPTDNKKAVYIIDSIVLNANPCQNPTILLVISAFVIFLTIKSKKRKWIYGILGIPFLYQTLLFYMSDGLMYHNGIRFILFSLICILGYFVTIRIAEELLSNDVEKEVQ